MSPVSLVLLTGPIRMGPNCKGLNSVISIIVRVILSKPYLISPLSVTPNSCKENNDESEIEFDPKIYLSTFCGII